MNIAVQYDYSKYGKSIRVPISPQYEIDDEMRNIINSCYDKTKKIITENKDLLKLIAETLLEEETITKEQIDYLVENGHLPKDEKEIKEEKENTKKEEPQK